MAAVNEAAAAAERPAPAIDRDSAPYWEGLRRHELLVQRCSACGLHRWPARAFCPRCRSWDAEWIAVGGTGTLVTWTVVHHPVGRAFVGRVPYVVGRVRLDDAPEVVVVGDVVASPHGSLTAGTGLEAVFVDVSAELTVVDWRPADRIVGDALAEAAAE